MNNAKLSAKDVMEKLKLSPLPKEGGFFRQTYKSEIESQFNQSGRRSVCTAIYYLVTPDSFSALHRVKSDEMFHFYCGDPVEMIQIAEQLSTHTLGSDLTEGHSPQVLVERGIWQGLRLVSGGRWALMGTTVAPGFEFEDFELGSRTELLKEFPNLSDAIVKFTYDDSRTSEPFK